MSDLISRQAAIERYGNWYVEEGTEEGFISDMKHFLEMLPSAEPEWIPCSERLPEYGDYRESMECLDGCVWYFTDKGLMGLGYYYYSTKEWSTLRDLKPDGKVIAWMPLPKPYQEGEHE